MKELIAYPRVSAVLPSIRRKNLDYYIENLSKQTYQKDKFEIVVAWGGKERLDDMVEKYGIKVIYNNTPDLEERRKIAVESATGEWIFMADDDNFFPNPNYIKNMMTAILMENASAGEAVWQYYSRNDYIANRYCALVGSYDPCTIYLKRQDSLPVWCKKWILGGKVEKETESYFLVSMTPSEIPTMGDQGFLVKKEDVLLGRNGKTLMHMDVCAALAECGRGKFIFMKDYFGHDCVQTKKQLLGKLKRNIDRFQVESHSRKMNYEINLRKMLKLGFVLGTFIIPIKDAIKGFVKIHDPAWFLHPVICFQVACIYTKSTLSAKLFGGKWLGKGSI